MSRRAPSILWPVTIGQAAALSGISAKMVRHYESLGLLPGVGRTDSGYRQYSEAEVHTLRFIKRSRDLGFSMTEIAELVALWQNRRRASASVKRIAQQHVAELTQRIEAMQAMQRTLNLLQHQPPGGRLTAFHRPAQGIQTGGQHRRYHQEAGEGAGQQPEAVACQCQQRQAEAAQHQTVGKADPTAACHVTPGQRQPAHRLMDFNGAYGDGRWWMHRCWRLVSVASVSADHDGRRGGRCWRRRSSSARR